MQRIRGTSSTVFTYTLLATAILMGGLGLLLFGAYTFRGPAVHIPLGFTETNKLLWDALLSCMFFLQHSVMARESADRRVATVVGPDRTTMVFALAAGIVLTATMGLWQPSTTVIYHVRGFWRSLIYAGQYVALGGVVWGAYTLRRSDPFGVTESGMAGDETAGKPKLVTSGLYSITRHPLYLFVLILIWVTPKLTADRLLFNVLWSIWIYAGLLLEERDLVRQFGDEYREYRRRVPRLFLI